MFVVQKYNFLANYARSSAISKDLPADEERIPVNFVLLPERHAWRHRLGYPASRYLFFLE
jgi:hypothetical protein